MNSYYNHAIYPTPNSPGSSAQMRAELQLIANGFDKLPVLSGGVANQVVLVNSGGTGLTTSSALAGLAITASTINSTTVGSATPAGGWFTTLSATGAAALGSNVTIGGGTINGVTIGGATPGAGVFTTLSASGGLTGNVTGNLTGNVTGNLTGNVTGNLTGNVTATTGTSTFNNVTLTGTLNMDAGTTGTIENLSTPVNNGDAANKGYVDTQDAMKLSLSGGTMSGAIAMGANRVTGLGDPVNPQDAATKVYVDNAVQGLDAKASCRVATTASITLSGTQTIDGIAVVAGDRVLVKDQATASQNGIYVVAAGSWSRATDADTWDELVKAFVFVERGTAGANNGYVCTIEPGGSLGSTAVSWVQFSGAGQITAGAGMSKIGNTLNVGTASSARIVVNSDDIDLATTGISAGTYRSITVDVYGRATAGTNPTTLSGYGITDAYTSTQTDTLLAGRLALTGGTMSGAIAMGTNRITGLGDPSSAQDAATKNYIDTVFGSTVSAAASASAANASQIAAAASEANALTYAGQALTSANNAAASFDSFDDRYLGSKTVDPTVDNDGNALIEGAIYWNSVSKIMKVWNGSAWAATYLPASGYLALSGGTMTGNITFAGGQTWPTFNQNTTGNAATATALQTARNINGVSFNGTADITVADATKLPLSGGSLTGNLNLDDTLLVAWGGGTGRPYVSGNKASGYLELGVGGVERFRIGSSGQLGIGGANFGTSGQFLTSQGSGSAPVWGNVLSGVTLNDGYTEEVFTLTGTTPALSAANGSIQTWALTANSTPTESLSNGQSLILGITAGSYTVTWPSTTWSKVGGSGTAPTLTSSGVNWVILWKVGGTLRGAFLGTA